MFGKNPIRFASNEISSSFPLGLTDIYETQDRFLRFAPLLASLFPELARTDGRIESDLLPAPCMQKAIELSESCGRLWIKVDPGHTLLVAGSIKARGGFHEVLEFAENLAIKSGLIQASEDCRAFNSSEVRSK